MFFLFLYLEWKFLKGESVNYIVHKRCYVFTCKSFCGFQSESNMIQMSAAVRLMPRPPARVQRRNTKRSESTLLKRSMAACRRFPRTLPSIRSYVYLHVSYKFQIRRHFLFATSFFMNGNYQFHSFSTTVLICYLIWCGLLFQPCILKYFDEYAHKFGIEKIFFKDFEKIIMLIKHTFIWSTIQKKILWCDSKHVTQKTLTLKINLS